MSRDLAISTPTSPAFCLPLRVYWEDTDAGGVVYYANYLKFAERARTEWLRALGLDQQHLADTEGLLFVVGSVEVRYLRPARLDDRLLVEVHVAARHGASLEFVQPIRRDDPERTLLAQARVLVACVQAGSLRPRRLPAPLLRALDDRQPTQADGRPHAPGPRDAQ